MIFALDIATRTGFAYGLPGAKRPTSGSIRFASPGSSHEAVFAAALSWATKTFRDVKPSLVVWEAPMPPSLMKGQTNVGTTAMLFGLPAVIGAVAYLVGIHDLRHARTVDVRRHFINANPKGPIAKKQTVQKCRALGWDVVDDNEADACAIWSYMVALIDPKLALRTVPLFQTIGRAGA